MSTGKYYETGMGVTYDPKTKTVAVRFRGKATNLAGTYSTEAEGIKAGESYCSHLGWAGQPVAGTAKSMLQRKNPW